MADRVSNGGLKVYDSFRRGPQIPTRKKGQASWQNIRASAPLQQSRGQGKLLWRGRASLFLDSARGWIYKIYEPSCVLWFQSPERGARQTCRGALNGCPVHTWLRGITVRLSSGPLTDLIGSPARCSLANGKTSRATTHTTKGRGQRTTRLWCPKTL